MAKKDYSEQLDFKVSLGKLIVACRNKKKLTLRYFAQLIDLPPSNVVYLEKGTNVPSPEAYERIIKVLEPEEQEHQLMDSLYARIRNLPPPDICNAILKNNDLGDIVRTCNTKNLSASQMKQIKQYILSINS